MHSFRVRMNDDEETLFVKLKKACWAQALIVKGDSYSGIITGPAKGRYVIGDGYVDLEFTKKPWVITWKGVEIRIRSGFAQV